MEENQEEKKEIIETNVEQEPSTEMISSEANKKSKVKKERKGSYILGTIGALLGGLVATLPWILTYIFVSNLVIPVFATLIPIGAFLGYKIFKGKIKKGFLPIIIIISLLIIAILTTFICPTILMIQSKYEPTWNNLMGLYSDTREEIRTAIIEDLLVGILFTVVGIVFISHFIREQLKRLMTEEQLKIEHQQKKDKLKEQTQIIKKACLNFNSLSKENAAKKKVIIKELVQIFNLKSKKAKLYFKNALLNGFLKKHKGKYYYDEADEEEKLENFIKIRNRLFPIVKVLLIIILLVVAITLRTYIYLTINRTHNVSDSGIQIEVDHENQNFYGTDEQITKEFGVDAANYYDFILIDKNNKYELYGLAIPNIQYEDKDFTSIIQEDRDYWGNILGEKISISEVEDKQFGDNMFKAYNYSYTSDSGKECIAVIYLYQGKSSYLWINVYADIDVELTKIDTIIKDLVK